MKKAKTILVVFVTCVVALILSGCEKNVKLDSLSNTYWECIVDTYNYSKIWFYSDNKGKVILRSSSSDEETVTEVGWTCKQSGYVSIKMFPGTKYEKEWMSGTFDGDACSLTLGKLDYKYKGKAQ